MKEKLKEANTKINLSVPPEFAELLTVKAHNEHLRTATWIKQFLMKKLLGTGDKEDKKSMNENGKK